MMKKFLSKILLIALLIPSFSFLGSAPVLAGGSIYLSPGSKTVSQGSNFSISVRVSSSDPIDTAQANLSYPVDKLDFVSISYSGSAFPIQAESSGGSGVVKIGRGIAGTVSGDKLVGTVTFRAKPNFGTAAVSFAAGTEADRAGSVIVGAGSGSTLSFTNPPPPPPPPPPADKVAPKISDVKVVKATIDSVTISWKTDEASTSIVDYGTDKGYFLSTEKTDLVTTHEVTVNSKFLQPATAYHFQARSKDAAGNEVKSADSIFRTAGYTLKITVLGSDGKPMKKIKVILYSKTTASTTDKKGVVEFKDINPGKHVLAAQVSGKVINNEIEVKDPGPEQIKSKDKDGKEIIEVKVKTQELTIKLSGVSPQTDFVKLVGLVLIIIGVAALGFLAYRRIRKTKTDQTFGK